MSLPSATEGCRDGPAVLCVWAWPRGQLHQPGSSTQCPLARALTPLFTFGSSLITLLLTQFQIWHFGYHSNSILPFSDQIGLQLVNTMLAPPLLWQPETILHRSAAVVQEGAWWAHMGGGNNAGGVAMPWVLPTHTAQEVLGGGLVGK